MKKYLLAGVAGAALALGGVSLFAQETTQSKPDTGVKSDVSDAAHSTGRAAKKTARKTERGTKKATHKAAKKTRHGAEKVEDKTQTPPQ